VAIYVDANSTEQGQPGVAQWCVFRHNDVFAEFNSGSAARKKSGTTGEFMSCANVASVNKCNIFEQASPSGS